MLTSMLSSILHLPVSEQVQVTFYSTSALFFFLAIIISYPTSANGIFFFIKNARKI